MRGMSFISSIAPHRDCVSITLYQHFKNNTANERRQNQNRKRKRKKKYFIVIFVIQFRRLERARDAIDDFGDKLYSSSFNFKNSIGHLLETLIIENREGKRKKPI